MTEKNNHEQPEEGNQPSESPDDRAAREAAAAFDTQAFSPEDLDALIADLQNNAEESDGGSESEAENSAQNSAEHAEIDPHLALAEERLNDLKRLQAEYQNYRNRVKRDEQSVREFALVETLRELVPLLDDLDRIELAGDLEGSPLEVVATKFRGTLERMGLEKFGEVGETFDPNLHEAIAKLPAADAEGETVADVVQVGYAVGERQLRPAKVAVKTPAE